MGRWTRSLIPAVAALSAMFMVLPNGGGDFEVHVVAGEAGFAFDPPEIQIEPGQRVAFINESSATHSARCDGCRAATMWDTGDIQPGETVLVPFDGAEAYRFFCVYHGQQGMAGILTVGDAELEPAPSPSPGVPLGP